MKEIIKIWWNMDKAILANHKITKNYKKFILLKATTSSEGKAMEAMLIMAMWMW